MEEKEKAIEGKKIAIKTGPRNGGLPANPFIKGQAPKSPGRPRESAERKLIRKAAKQVAMSILENHGPKFAKKITKLSDEAKSETVQLMASQDGLNRIGVGASENRDKPNINILVIPSEIAERHGVRITYPSTEANS